MCQKDNINIHRKFEISGNFGCSKGVEKNLTFLPRDLPLSKFHK